MKERVKERIWNSRRHPGQLIYVERLARGISRRDLAGRADTSEQYIHYLESAYRPQPGGEMLQKIARSLEIPEIELLFLYSLGDRNIFEMITAFLRDETTEPEDISSFAITIYALMFAHAATCESAFMNDPGLSKSPQSPDLPETVYYNLVDKVIYFATTEGFYPNKIKDFAEWDPSVPPFWGLYAWSKRFIERALKNDYIKHLHSTLRKFPGLGGSPVEIKYEHDPAVPGAEDEVLYPLGANLTFAVSSPPEETKPEDGSTTKDLDELKILARNDLAKALEILDVEPGVATKTAEIVSILRKNGRGS